MFRDKCALSIKIFFAFLVSLRFSMLPHDIFKDRFNYLYRISESEFYPIELIKGDYFLIFKEPFFNLSNYLLGFFFDPEVVLSIYVFFNTFVVIFFVVSIRRSFFYNFLGLILLFTIPYFYGGVLGSVRQSLGLSIILINLMIGKGVKSRGFLISLFMASLFHVIFYLFFFLTFFLNFIFRLTGSIKYTIPFFVFYVFFVGVSWRLFTPFLSDSQQYDAFVHSVSGLTFLGWFLIFILYFVRFAYVAKESVHFYKESSNFILLIILFCFLVFYWMVPGPYRLLYLCAPFFVSSVVGNFNKYSALCYIATFFYSFFLMGVGAGAGVMNVDFFSFVYIFFNGVD